jgi:hypothetical protein
MRGSLDNKPGSFQPHSIKMSHLRDALILARERLVRAVSERAPESVLIPLRNSVGDILEKIERVHIRESRRK